ncbi:hypothetical protein Dimus_009081 [Dionaea muscipula]
MAVALRGRSELQQQVPKKWNKETEASSRAPAERSKFWNEHSKQQQLKNDILERRVAPVVYYLCRNGQLEHPHFMEVPLSSSADGLFLRDVITRLNLLRGKGIATQYSWSSKRSYKNGYVWHDLEENDFIHPVHGQDYVLKGSEILDTSPVYKNLQETASSSSRKADDEQQPVFPVRSHRRNQSCSSIDLHEYKVYKAETTGQNAGKSAATDASTQTDDKRNRRRATKDEEEEKEKRDREGKGGGGEQSTELCTEEISPPPSDSSPETLESLLKADGRVVLSTIVDGGEREEEDDGAVSYCPSGRMKASSVLMSLISCGSTSFRECGVTPSPTTTGTGVVQDHGQPLISISQRLKPRLPRGWNQERDEASSCSSSSRRLGKGKGKCGAGAGTGAGAAEADVEEYYSGSLLMDTNKDDEFPSLKRSSSYNAVTADRSLMNTGMAEDRAEEVRLRAKCIPRKAKT